MNLIALCQNLLNHILILGRAKLVLQLLLGSRVQGALCALPVGDDTRLAANLLEALPDNNRTADNTYL